MIQAKNIHKYYDQLHVLKGVDLHIQKGEIVSIVGASGAGKTTLLQILGTLDKPSPSPLTTEGGVFAESKIELKINGQDILTMNDKTLSKFRNLNLGFIFQFHQLLPEFTALENVCIPAYIANKSRHETETEAKKLLEYLGLSHRMNHKPNELSGGEQQRVAVARALVNKPSIILADEPTGNLDSKTSVEIMKLFGDIHASGNTVILVTHEEEIAAYANRVIRLRDGLIESDTSK